jgi:transketolase
MASRGLIPTIFGIQPFLIERALEQIKMDFAYPKLGVNVIGTGAAIDYPKYGYSHYCAEDVGILKMIPGVEFIAPGTSKQFLQLFNQSYRDGKPTFFRVSDHPNEVEDPDVEFGKANVIKRGLKATVVAVSTMLDGVLDACVNQDVTILYYTTLEPFDRLTLAQNCPSGNVLIVEPEFVGSLVFDVYESFPGKSIIIRHVGFPREIFRNYGTYEEKMDMYGLTSENIRKQLSHLVEG